jgi:hypothetical protein
MNRLILLRSAMILVLFSTASVLEARGPDVDWSDRAAWNCARTVAIRPFPIRPNSARIPAGDAVPYFASELLASLNRRGGIEKVFVAKGEEPVTADVILTGTFLDLGVQRRPVGLSFGALTSICSVSIRAFRSDGETPVFTIEASRELRLEEGDETGMGTMDAVAKDIAHELLKNRQACVAGDLHPLVPPGTAASVAAAPPTPVVTAPVAPSPAPAVVSAAPDAPPVAASGTPSDAPVAQPVAPMPPVTHAEAKENATTSIESNVPNADVFVDGKFIGNAPIATYMLTPGAHLIEVKARGYIAWSRELNVTRGSVTRVMASLVRP